MKSIKLIIFSLVIISMALVSCSKEVSSLEEISSAVEINSRSSNFDFGSAVYPTFTGQILDENLKPIRNVLITIGDKNDYTDKEGKFSIKEAQVFEKYALVTAEKENYFKGYRNLILPNKQYNEVDIMLLEKEIVGKFNSEKGGTVYINGKDHSIAFESGFVNDSDKLYVGDVSVKAKYVDPAGETIDLQMPGSLDFAESENGEPVKLVSYGMLHVDIVGELNQNLHLKKGNRAEIRLKVPEYYPEDVIEQTPIWNLDDEEGYWIESGVTRVIDGDFIFEVDDAILSEVINIDEDGPLCPIPGEECIE